MSPDDQKGWFLQAVQIGTIIGGIGAAFATGYGVALRVNEVEAEVPARVRVLESRADRAESRIRQLEYVHCDEAGVSNRFCRSWIERGMPDPNN